MAPPGCVVSWFRGHRPSHSPSRRTTAPTELANDVVEEVLLRLPPSDPAALVRAALVSKDWRRIVSSPAFLRRYRDRHGTAALVGFVSNIKNIYSDGIVRFDPASSSSLPRRVELAGWRALDAHHGRILLCGGAAKNFLVVWDPFTGERREVPSLPPLDPDYRWNAAVVCAEPPPRDHSHCRAFLVVLFREDPSTMTMLVDLYASTTTLWSQKEAGWIPFQGIDDVPPALVRRTVFFCMDSTTRLIGYDLDAAETVLVYSPTQAAGRTSIFATREDSLGFASLVQSKIYTWAWSATENVWLPSSSFDMESLLLFSELSSCVPVLGVTLVGAADGVYKIEGGRVTKKTHCTDIYCVIPYVTAFTGYGTLSSLAR